MGFVSNLFGGGRRDSSRAVVDEQRRQAAEARRREEDRQRRLDTGRTRIGDVFKDFDDEYYSQARSSFVDAHKPQLQEAWADSRDELKYGLARAGLLRSSAGAKRGADLGRALTLGLADLNRAGDEFAGGLRDQVDQRRSSALNQLYGTENPDIATNQALSGAHAIRSQPQPSYGIGDLFYNIFSNIGQYQAGQDWRQLNRYASTVPDNNPWLRNYGPRGYR